MTDETIRYETDSMGQVAVRSDRYWGAQTQRSLTHFAIGQARMPLAVVYALATIKKAAARCNQRQGGLSEELAHAIERAADEVIYGKLDEHFPLSIYQTGSGTQTNMNVNEVIASRANEILGGERGAKEPVHPNDHVNMSQSSNDTFPTAMALALLTAVERELLPALRTLSTSIATRREAFGDVVKIGRTHLMDAVPLTFGHELESYEAQLAHAQRVITAMLEGVKDLPIGGTAVGTGLNAPEGFDREMVAELGNLCALDLRVARSKHAMQAAHDTFVAAHGALRTTACALAKIANDVRWLASGPRAGLSELRIPANEPGSSIMPGKVNPTQCEALLMVCARVMGNDVTVGVAGASGDLELNVYKPVIAAACLESVALLSDAARSFEEHLVRGLDVDRDRVASYVKRSLMVVTALAPHVGYDRAAEAAKAALEQDRPLRDVAVAMGLVSGDEYDRIVDPARLARG